MILKKLCTSVEIVGMVCQTARSELRNGHEMSDCLRIKVQWNWGGARIVDTDSTATVFEALTANGFSALPNSILFVAHRGRFIESHFTLRYYGIKSGDILVCLLRALPTNDKSRRFLASLEPREPLHYTAVPAGMANQTDIQVEASRLSDLTFAGWEVHNGFTLILAELVRQNQEDTPTPGNQRRTVIAATPAICEDPLPMLDLTEKEKMGQYDRDWKREIISVIPEQQRRGNPPDGRKKP
jgi:hypothetical protein